MKAEYEISGDDAKTRGLIDVLCKLLVDCKQCGKCCDGSLFKAIPLNEKEINRLDIKDLDPITEEGFLSIGYTHTMKQPCKYFIDSKCLIYENRPSACRKYPSYVMPKSFQIFLMCEAGVELYTKIVKKLEAENNG